MKTTPPAEFRQQRSLRANREPTDSEFREQLGRKLRRIKKLRAALTPQERAIVEAMKMLTAKGAKVLTKRAELVEWATLHGLTSRVVLKGRYHCIEKARVQ